MNKTVLRALLTLFSAMLFTAHTLVAMPTAFAPKGVLGGPAYSIGAAKSITAIVPQPNGTYNIAYVVVVRNYGGTSLSNVQVVDDLSNTFPNPVTYSIVLAPVASGSLNANVGFNGNSNVNLLAGTGTLAPGAQETITFTVNVDPNGQPGTFFNTAIASGDDGNGGNAVADSSDWGTNPDPDQDGNPNEAGENNPTPTILTGNTITTIGAARTIVSDTIIDCIYYVNYLITLRNLGTEPLNSIQVTDDLLAAFPSPATFTISNLSASPGLTLSNTTFDGQSNNTLLNPNSSQLGIGQTGTITYTVALNLNSTCGTFNSSSIVTAQGSLSNNSTTDISDWGTNPDPDLDGNPNEPVQAENDPTPYIVECPDVDVAKFVESVVLQPDGSYNVTYTVVVKNNGTTASNNLTLIDDLSQTFPAPVTTTQNSISAQAGLVPNLGFGTNNNWNLLDGSSSINPGETLTLTFTINVLLNNTADTLFNNSAIITALGACGASSVDTSVNGNNPDVPGVSPTPVVLLPTITQIPGGFSPNGDGINDLFVLTNIGGKKVDIQIFNRWGACVYKNANYDNSWNGTANTGFGLGEDLPTGTYWYVIKIDDTKEVKEYANYLTLTR